MFMILDILQSFPSIFFLNNLLDLIVKNEVNVFDKAQLISGHLPPALVIAIESNVWFTASGQGDCIHIRAVRIWIRNRKESCLDAVTCWMGDLLQRFSRWNAGD